MRSRVSQHFDESGAVTHEIYENQLPRENVLRLIKSRHPTIDSAYTDIANSTNFPALKSLHVRLKI